MAQEETHSEHRNRRPARPEYGQYDEDHRDGRIPEAELARARERQEQRLRLEAEEQAHREELGDPAGAGRGQSHYAANEDQSLRYRPPGQQVRATPWDAPARRGGTTSRLGVWAAVLGTVGLLLSIFTVPVLLGVAGLVCGIVALVRSRRTGARRGPAVVGVVTGLLSVVVSIVLVVSAWSMLVDHCGSPVGQDPAAWQQCGYGMIEDLQNGR